MVVDMCIWNLQVPFQEEIQQTFGTLTNQEKGKIDVRSFKETFMQETIL